MKKWLLRAAGISVALVLLSGIALWAVARAQGLSEGEIARGAGAKVVFDRRGIPTIEAETWASVLEAQGFVVAAERLFQMDLMRRSASGRLGPWFGSVALPLDRRRVLEDWDGVAARAYEDATLDERRDLDAYARGVNRFIREYRHRWGLEYLILGAEPEPWSGKDSLLILLAMADELTSSAEADAAIARASRAIGPTWTKFIFPPVHPWNRPMFGDPAGDPEPPPLPWTEALPAAPIRDDEFRSETPGHAALDQVRAPSGGAGPAVDPGPEGREDPEARGPLPASNEWAWCGKTGCWLANDPHLGASVPHLWYAVRLRTSPRDWVVGVAIPGLPWVVLGMNPHLAWGFTNVGEDVDDLLIERVSADGTQYLAKVEDGKEVWAPIRRVERSIELRGAKPETVTALFTHRGPLEFRADLGGVWCSRQWLPLAPGVLHLPAGIARAASWPAINDALDQMSLPAQNVLVLDRQGNIGYRASGTGVERRVSGRVPAPALEGEWRGFAPRNTRPRLLLRVAGEAVAATGAGPLVRTTTVAASSPRFVATANERNWPDPLGDGWVDDLRKERIRRSLLGRDDFSREDMIRLQLDTESRYFRLLLDWVRAHADPASDQGRALLDAWHTWDGSAAAAPQIFTDAIEVDRALTRLCARRLARRFLPPGEQEPAVRDGLRTAWVIAMLEAKGGPGVFGLDERELANKLLEVALDRRKRRPEPYPEHNHWSAQHPFVAALPVIGRLFAVQTPPQRGWRGVVRVEQPKFGASVRLVWDPRNPAESRWTLPVGQSGHALSAHYKDLQKTWFADEYFEVLDPAFAWE